ncbi:MAG TPA: penicillin-binding protein 2 [Verrucomicrobiales bacterium]|nr:penicillin-binding protein 2 [Verrucomicrobiales bacterium]
MALFTALALRLVIVHAPGSDRGAARKGDESSSSGERAILAERGSIVDRNGEILATLRPIFSVILEPSALPRRNEDLRTLLRVMGEPVEEEAAAPSGQSRRRLKPDERERIKEAEDERRLAEEKRLKDAYLGLLSGILEEELGVPAKDVLAQVQPDRDPARYPTGERYWRYRRAYATNDAEVEMVRRIESRLEPLAQEGIRRQVWGVVIEDRAERIYPLETTACHIVGWVRTDDRIYPGDKAAPGDEKAWIAPPDEAWQRNLKNRQLFGVEGVEGTMDKVLRGLPGRKAQGLLGGQVVRTKPQAGDSVRLTIDVVLQRSVEKHLAEAWEFFRPDSISAVGLDTATGEILALANRPWFNLSSGEIEGENQEGLRNHAVSSAFEPGSIFKILSYGCAIDAGAAQWDELVDFGERWGEPGWRESWKIQDPTKFRITATVREAFYRSSNIIAYKLVKRVGPGAFYNSIRSYGIGIAPGSGLGAEAPGYVPHPQDNLRWSGSLTTSRIAFGYNVQVTPLQMAAVVATVANGGKYMQPRILAARLDRERRVLESYPPREVRQVISPKTAAGILSAMEEVVHNKNGTGKAALVPGYRAAGKTGTARNYSRKSTAGADLPYIVSFAGCIPAGAPRLAIVVMMDGPKELHGMKAYGGTMAAPVFSAIAGDAMAYLGIAPTEPVD